MKVKIGPYEKWYTTRALEEWFQMKRHKVKRAEVYNLDWPLDKWDYRFESLCDSIQWILNKTINRFNAWRGRTVKIRIDDYDTWGMDHTLSMIILPMLKQLKATKHGSPWVDDEDVPDGLGLRSTEHPPVEHEYEWDGGIHDRWNWVMDEMIWTFEQHVDDDWEQQYYSGKSDHMLVPVDADGNELGEARPFFEGTREERREERKKLEGLHSWKMVDGPNDTFEIDKEGIEAHQERINNGMRLFAKYYQGLWD